MQKQYSESQLLAMTSKTKPKVDFKVKQPAYLGFDIRIAAVNVAAFIDIFKKKRLGNDEPEENHFRPVSQKQGKPRRFVLLDDKYRASKVYNGFVRDDV